MSMPSGILTRWKRQLRQAALRILSSSRFFSGLYYTFASSAFQREQQAVLRGKYRYYQNLHDPEETQYLLRRNIHRLEKGLLMRPRRAVFATGYILDTVQAYQRAMKKRNGSAPVPAGDLAWASDVLGEYFSVTAAHPVLDKARDTFQQVGLFDEDDATIEKPGELSSLTPYHRSLSAQPPVSYDDLYRLSRQRRSVRWFRDEPVPRSTLDQAIRIAAQSPSACNRQPFQFRIFDEPEDVRRVSTLPAGTSGYAENIPTIIVIVGRLRAYFSDRDRHVVYIDGALAAMSLMFALETLGLSSCPINWPDIEEREVQMAKALDLESDERPIMLLGVGYPDPDGMVAASQKKSLDEIRTYADLSTARSGRSSR